MDQPEARALFARLDSVTAAVAAALRGMLSVAQVALAIAAGAEAAAVAHTQ